VQVVFDSPYFSYNVSLITVPQKIEIYNNQYNVPVGQYYFRVKLPMTIDYFRANAPGQTGLIINSTGQTIQGEQPATWYFYKNNVYQSQGTRSIFWAMNYQQNYFFNFTNTPNTTQNMQLRYQHIYQGSYTSVNLVPYFDGLQILGVWYVNPTRNSGTVAASYPLIYTISGSQYFGMYTYLLLFYNNQLIQFSNNRNDIDSSENTGIKIKSNANDPFLRDITLTISVDGSGNFINI
jgi:hypothetical protein